jgi:hypothetical protein
MFLLIFLLIICIAIVLFTIYERNNITNEEIINRIPEKEKNNLNIIEKKIQKNNSYKDLELEMIDNMKEIPNYQTKQITSRVEAILPDLEGASPI